MFEDVAGERAAGTGARYSVCAECGRTFPRRAIHAHEAGLQEDSRSEFSETCLECEELLAKGERPVRVDDP